MTTAHPLWKACCLLPLVFSAGLLLAAEPSTKSAAEWTATLERAGKNRPRIEQAINDAPDEQKEGIRFLVLNMPDNDLKSLSAEFLRENTALAYQAWNESPWKKKITKEMFLNEILPYACINEKRDHWRKDFREKCVPLVKNAESPGRAAVLLNQNFFKLIKVKYSTKRNRADQGPHESIQTGLASCTGLAILLVDACRSVGVPARFVGVPLWADGVGNHSWVEVWDDGWHFMGAAEPSGDDLNKAWFVGKATTAKRDDPWKAIYATSFKRTPAPFPLPWSPETKDVFAVNVTDRYTRHPMKIPDGYVQVMFRVVEQSSGDRVAANIEVKKSSGAVIFEGTTNDERFDANDHLTAIIPASEKYEVEARFEGRAASASLDTSNPRRLLTIPIEAAPQFDQPSSALRAPSP